MNDPTGPANLDFARKLLQHSFWEDQRVWDLAIAPLTDAQFTQELAFGLGSIQRECLHIMEAQSLCLRRVLGASNPPAVSEEGRQRAALHDQWRAIHRAWAPVIDELDADTVFSDRVIDDGEGIVRLKVWQLIFDLVYLGTARRAEIMRMVAEVDAPPEFDLSLMQFLTGVYRQ